MIELYQDQQEVMQVLRNEMKRSKSVLLQSPTGSGKTAMSVYMLANAKNKGSVTVFVVPRKELLKQTALSFEENGIKHSFIAAGYSFNPYANTYIGMTDTMARRLDKLPKANMVIIDETHYGSGSLDKIINHYKAQGAWIIGLSATPWRLDGSGLGKWYSSMVQGKSIRWLIENGRLSHYRLFGPDTPDLSGIDTQAGDYAKAQLADLMERDRVLIGNAVRHYKTHAMGKLNIAYCTSVKHSQIVAQSFNDAGIPALHIDGSMNDEQRRVIVRKFAARDALVLCNCELLTFGFDLKMASGIDVTIEAMSDLRPTKSLALQMQKWGRVLRYKEEPAIIFDHAGNWIHHGTPWDDREWTLEGKKKRKGGERAPPTRQCPECFAIHTPEPECPECGHIYEYKGREVDEVDGKLEEIDIEKMHVSKKAEQAQAQTLDDLIALARKRGMKYPAQWAAHVLSARMRKQYARG